MKQISILLFSIAFPFLLNGQTPLTEAVNFHVKTIEGETIWLFPLLDDDNIVVIDFFSTTCGPCQDYAPDFQEAYEEFGENQGNVFFMGINWGDDNDGVHEFDSIFGLTYPSVSGTQGGGDDVYEDYEVLSYPTVIIITPDHQIVEQYIWPPTAENIISAVIAAGGMYVGVDDQVQTVEDVVVYPNPVTDKAFLKIKLSSAETVQLEIVDLLGNILFSSENQFLGKGNSKIEIPVSGLINGLYFVRLSINNAGVKTSRFILAR